MELIIGIVIGVVSTVLAQAVVEHTQLFRSRMRVLVDQPPAMAPPETAQQGANTIHLLRVTLRIENSGWKPGYISAARLRPTGLRQVPNAEMISISPRHIDRRKTMEVLFVVLVKHDAQSLANPAGFAFELLDENDREIGALEVEGQDRPFQNP